MTSTAIAAVSLNTVIQDQLRCPKCKGVIYQQREKSTVKPGIGSCSKCVHTWTLPVAEVKR